MKKVMRKVNAVWKSVGASARQLRNDLGIVLWALGAAKVMVSLGTSSKNALLKKEGPKTTSECLQDASRNSFDLQEGLKRGPQSDAQATVCAQNTVNTAMF